MSDILGGSVEAALYFHKAGHYIFRQVGERGAVTVKTLDARTVQKAFAANPNEDSGWLPPGLIRTGNGLDGIWYVYSRPPAFATINLVAPNGAHYYTIPVPGLVMLGIERTHLVFAWRGETLDLESELCKAPYPNVHEDGRICWGQNTPPQASPANAETVPKMFFDSAFNADLANEKCRRFPQDVRKLLRKIAGQQRFPDEELVPVERGVSVRAHFDHLIEAVVK